MDEISIVESNKDYYYDPIPPSPINQRRRHESTNSIPRRSSLDQNPTMGFYDKEDIRMRSNSLPRGKPWLYDSYLNKGHCEFWTGSLNRPKKSVKFDDQPPARPPPPAPERQNQFPPPVPERQNQFASVAQTLPENKFAQSPPPLPERQNQFAQLSPPTSERQNQFAQYSPPPPAPPLPERQESLKFRTNPNNLFRDLPSDHEDSGPKAYRDPWYERYGKAVLDNTLQERIENRRQKLLHGTPVQQFIMEQECEPVVAQAYNPGSFNSSPPVRPTAPITPIPPAHSNPTYGIAPSNPTNGIAPRNPTYGIAPSNPSNGIAHPNSTNGITPQNPTFGIAPSNPSNGIAHSNPTNGLTTSVSQSAPVISNDYAMVRDIVLSILKSQGVPNPSEEVVDTAIRDHLNRKVLATNPKAIYNF